MNYVSWEISVVVLLPALFLCGFVYYKDKIEREPVGLLALLFVIGGVTYIPSYALERLISGGFDKLFSHFIEFGADGVAEYSSELASVLHSFLTSFFAIALVEACMKWLVLYFSTRRNKHFNYLFDGIVYSVFISLGFCACENLRFAWLNGWDMIVLKALSSVPSHLFVGILMGYYFSRWHVHKEADDDEEELIRLGIISKRKLKEPWKRLFISLVVPMCVCGVFFFASSIDSKIINTIFYFTVFIMLGVSFINIDRIASRDRSAYKFSKKLLMDKHPELDGAVWNELDRIRKEK